MRHHSGGRLTPYHTKAIERKMSSSGSAPTIQWHRRWMKTLLEGSVRWFGQRKLSNISSVFLKNINLENSERNISAGWCRTSERRLVWPRQPADVFQPLWLLYRGETPRFIRSFMKNNVTQETASMCALLCELLILKTHTHTYTHTCTHTNINTHKHTHDGHGVCF